MGKTFRSDLKPTGLEIISQTTYLPKTQSQFSRTLAGQNTLQKIRDHYELNVYVVDGTRRRTFAKVIVDPSLTQ